MASGERSGAPVMAFLVPCAVLLLLVACDSQKPPADGPAAQQTGRAGGGGEAGSDKKPPAKSGWVNLTEDAPVLIQVTYDPVEIRKVFGPPNPTQKDVPVSAARYVLAKQNPDYEQVKLLIPEWEVEHMAQEDGKLKGPQVKFFYSYNQKRPGSKEVEFNLFGYRKGVGTQFYQGFLNPQE